MNSYFKLEFKKAIFSRRTIICVLIILALLSIPYLEEIRFPHPGLDGVDYFIRISHFSAIGFIGPMIAGLIYSSSIVKDKESGFINKLLEVIDLKTYFKVKLAVNALITFIVFAVSHSILILYFIIKFGVNNIVVKDIGSGAFATIYGISKIQYIIVVLLVIALSSVAFSIFVLGITTAIEKKSISYIFPVFYVIVTGICFEIWSFNNVIDFNVTELFNSIANYTTKGLNIMIYDLILVLFGILLLYRFGYKRNLMLYKEFNVQS